MCQNEAVSDSRQNCNKSCPNSHHSCSTNECAAFLQMRHILRQYLTLCANTDATLTLFDGSSVTGRLNALYPADCGGLLLLANDDNVVSTIVPICQIAAFTPVCTACIEYLPTPSHAAYCCNYACEGALEAYVRTACRDITLKRNNTVLAEGKITAADWGIITVTTPGSGETAPTTTYIASSAVSSATVNN